MKVNVYLPHSFDACYKADYIVGVDYGAFLLAKKAIIMDVAIGDFDSTTKAEYEFLSEKSKKVIKLPAIKDETDSEAAIIYLKEQGFNDITLIGDTGSRIDHFLINYRLIEKYGVVYILENSKIFNLKPGIHKIKKDYQYLSLFTNTECFLSLSGTKYPIKSAKINYYDTFTSSNEIIDEYAVIEIFSGNINVVLSNDK